MSNKLKKGDKLEVVDMNKTVEVVKATEAFAHLSDGNRVKQKQLPSGDYERYMTREETSGLHNIGYWRFQHRYRLLTPERIAEKQRQQEEYMAARRQKLADMKAQIIAKLQEENPISASTIEALHKILFP